MHPLELRGGVLPVDPELDRELLDFRFQGFVDWIPGRRRVHGVLAGTFRSNCDRCLGRFDREVRLEVDVPVLLGEEPEAADLEAEESALRVAADDAALDLAKPFGVVVLLEVPIKNLCREDCRGLCPGCGADRNAADCGCEPSRKDPRWNALGGLRFPPNEE